MSHYFETPAAQSPRHRVRASIWGRELEFVSAPGVFSAYRLDPGTQVLLRSAPPPPATSRRLLDLGCGFGPIAIALALACPHAQVDAIDVNDLALQLTRDNADRHQVADRVRTARPEDLPPHDGYDEIWSNPPIRIGKAALHELLLTWLPRLRAGGTGWLVVGKNLGADSLQRWLAEQGWVVDRVASSKGFRVFRVQRNSTPPGVEPANLPPA